MYSIPGLVGVTKTDPLCASEHSNSPEVAETSNTNEILPLGTTY